MNLESMLKVSVAVVSMIFAAAGCADAAHEGEQVDDIIGGKSASAYPEAVLVDMLRGGKVTAACSGALIAPNVVLTAGHCVYGWQGWQVVAPYAGGKRIEAKSAVTYDWKVPGAIVDPSKHDVGLIFLASPIDLPRYPILATRPLPAGERVINIGRIRDGALSNTALFASKPVKVLPGAPYGFPHDYVAADVIEHGDSGGPVVLPGAAAPHTIVAINSGANEAFEALARVDLVVEWISDQIATHTGAPAACAHDPCVPGKRLSASCDACVTSVCAEDVFCCDERWDEQCAGEVTSICGQSCGDVP